jgi:hypothetical protein
MPSYHYLAPAATCLGLPILYDMHTLAEAVLGQGIEGKEWRGTAHEIRTNELRSLQQPDPHEAWNSI